MNKNLYLQRYATPGPRLSGEVSEELSLVVVIPACAEENLEKALISLQRCEAPEGRVEVIVVVNHAASSDQMTRRFNLQSLEKAEKLLHDSPYWLKIKAIRALDLPDKHAGVGMARKIGMDEAVRRFERLIVQQPDIHQRGIIVCFDADCLCDPNYLKAIEAHFKLHKTPACSIYYEHPLAGNEYPEEIYQGIIQYEMYLRYYVDALRWAGYPFAWQTVGSAIAVRSSAYQQQGGMNLRKAGEDFYFLQKLFPLPGFTELNTTRVIPSPRISHRVPFGTGKVMSEWMDQKKHEILAYSTTSYQELRYFLTKVPSCYHESDINAILAHLPPAIKEYLQNRNFEAVLLKIKSNSGGYDSFQKQFFAWFNGLKVLQYFHFAQKHYHRDMPVVEATRWLINALDVPVYPTLAADELLLQLRKLDRKWNYRL